MLPSPIKKLKVIMAEYSQVYQVAHNQIMIIITGKKVTDIKESGQNQATGSFTTITEKIEEMI